MAFVYQPMKRNPSNVPVQSVETSLAIIEELQRQGQAGVSTIADALDVSKSTTHNHLRTLERHEYVTQEGNEFKLGFRFLDVGGSVRDRDPTFQFIQPTVQTLAVETGEICQFVVRENEHAIVTFMEQGEQAVETRSRVGTRLPLGQLTAGRTLLAVEQQSKDEEAESQSSYDAAKLAADGYLAADEGYVKGLRAIAISITNTDGDVLGAISISGPAHRLRDEEYKQNIADRMLNASNELELNVSYSRF